MPWTDGTLQDETDAYFYLSPVDSLTMSHPSPDIYRDEDYVRELDRRHRIVEGQPLHRALLLRERSASFVDH